jgi:CBS-domain-containing membrane protein
MFGFKFQEKQDGVKAVIAGIGALLAILLVDTANLPLAVSYGASSLILFFLPKALFAYSSAVLLSYIVCSLVGIYVPNAAIAVGVCVALLPILRIIHPPAVGLAIAMQGRSEGDMATAVLGIAIILVFSKTYVYFTEKRWTS